MSPTEFKKRLGQLQEVILRALAYHAVWSNLKLHDEARAGWSIDDQNRLLGRWRGFFTPVTLALIDMSVIQFAKAFDTDSRTASFRVLINAARGDPGLVPQGSATDLQAISAKFEQNDSTLETLKQLRNQQLAHVDANPDPVDPLMSQTLERFTEDVKSAFNQLSAAHDGSIVAWDFPLRTSNEHSAHILGVLVDDMWRDFEARGISRGEPVGRRQP